MFKKTDDQKALIKLLIGPALYIMAYGGSRSGKSVGLFYALCVRAMKAKSRHLIVRRHFTDLKRSMWNDTMQFVLANALNGVPVKKNSQDHFIEFPNGSQIWFCGLDDKERADKILGTQYSSVFFNEASELSYKSVKVVLTRLAEKSGLALKAYFDQNPPAKRHWTYRLFEEHLDPEQNTAVSKPEMYASIPMNPHGNRDNLPEEYFDILDGLSEREKKRFLLGQYQDDAEGALWNRDMINKSRVVQKNLAHIDRIVIGIDPAVSSNETSDEHGIVAVGKAGDEYYVLEDKSLRGTPGEWGEVAVALYHELQADRLIPEVNNGGDLVVSNIHNIDPSVSVRAVRATRGKMVRAEPVAALYERGKVHHVGEFPLLEDQMCSYDPEMSTDSPDRMDALVWAMTELMGKKKKIARVI